MNIWGEPERAPHWSWKRPRMQNNGIYMYVCMYLCLYHLPHVYCTLVPEICVCPDKLHVFRYIYMLTCVIYNCIRPNSKVDWMLATHSLTVHLFNWWSANSLSNCLIALYSDSKLLLAWQFERFLLWSCYSDLVSWPWSQSVPRKNSCVESQTEDSWLLC